MKGVALVLLLFVSLSVAAQKSKSDSLQYIYYTDPFGQQRKALVATPPHILIVAGDSLFTVANEFQLHQLLAKQQGFNILHDPDSVKLFLSQRIKAVVILGKKGKK